MKGVGLGLAVASAAMFGTAGPFATSLMHAGWTPGGAVTMRIAVAAAVLTVPALIALRGRWSLLRENAPTIAIFGFLAVACAQLFFFSAVRHVSVGVGLLLEYTGILMVVLWLWVRHGQRPRRLTIIGGAVAIAGLMLVLDITGPQHVDLVGVLWGLAAGVGLATYFVISGRADDRLPPVVMVWGGMIVGAVTLGLLGLVGILPLTMSSADVHFAGTRMSWIVPALGLSVIAAALSYVAGVGGARRLGARVASFVGLAEVLFAILFAWLFIDQQPSVQQLVGGVVVLAGIALVRADDREPAAHLTEQDIPVPA